MNKLHGYQITDFNTDGVLKVSLLLWLVLCYLSRHLLLFLMDGFNTFMLHRAGLGSVDFASFNSKPMFLLASLPALIVLAAALRRSAQSGAVIRNIWRHARKLMIAAALIDLILLVTASFWHWLRFNEWIILGILLDIYILVYLWRSARVRDTFADFPE